MGLGMKERGKTKFFDGEVQREPSLVSPLVANPDLLTLRSVLGLITAIILKSERVFSFKATNLQHLRLEI